MLSSQNKTTKNSPNKQTPVKKSKCPLGCSSLVLSRHVKISIFSLQPHLNSNLLDNSRLFYSVILSNCPFPVWLCLYALVSRLFSFRPVLSSVCLSLLLSFCWNPSPVSSGMCLTMSPGCLFLSWPLPILSYLQSPEMGLEPLAFSSD